MKRLKTLALFALAALLCACAAPLTPAGVDDALIYDFAEDDQYYFHTPDGHATLAQSEDALFFFKSMRFLMRFDKQTGETRALCDKQGCPHDAQAGPQRESACQAFFPYTFNTLKYHKGYLYFFTDADNEAAAPSRQITRVPIAQPSAAQVLPLDTAHGTPDAFFVHRGYLYAALTHNTLVKYDLNDLAAPPKTILSAPGMRMAALSNAHTMGPYIVLTRPATSGIVKDDTLACIDTRSDTLYAFDVPPGHPIGFALINQGVVFNVKNGAYYSPALYSYQGELLHSYSELKAGAPFLIYCGPGDALVFSTTFPSQPSETTPPWRLIYYSGTTAVGEAALPTPQRSIYGIDTEYLYFAGLNDPFGDILRLPLGDIGAPSPSPQPLFTYADS